jgi:hypothetical protein
MPATFSQVSSNVNHSFFNHLTPFKMKRLLSLFMLLALFALQANGQTNPTPQGLPYSEDFSSLAHNSTTYPAGWQGHTISTSPGASYNTGGPTADRNLTGNSTAATTSGNVHNYDGKLGFLNTSSLDLTLTLALNTTGFQNVVVAYDIMTIRNPYDGSSNTRINEVSLQYRVGVSDGWTTITGQEYQNNTTTQTGAVTTPQKLESKTVTLPAACDNQSVVQIRWASRQDTGVVQDRVSLWTTSPLLARRCQVRASRFPQPRFRVLG